MQNAQSATTAETLAKQHGVNESTIRRDGQFAEAVERAKTVEPDIEDRIVRGDAPPKKDVIEAAKALEV